MGKLPPILSAVGILLALGARGALGQLPFVEIPETACPNRTITLTHLVSLGDPSAMGLLDSMSNKVVRDSRGRYYVFAIGSPHFWVFDSAGQILEKLGRQGSGRGEFSTVSSVLISQNDSLFVFDHRQARVTVFSPEYEIIRVMELDVPIVGRGLFVDGVMVVNQDFRTPDRVGYPIHVVDSDGRIERSFGSLAGGAYRPDMREALEMRTLASAGADGIWVGRINQYVFERWTLSGEMVESFRRTPEWFPTWWHPEGNAETPPVPVTSSLIQEGDILWVLIKVPGSEWRSAVEATDKFYRVTDQDRYRNTVIEAIDLKTQEVLASTRVPQSLGDFVGPRIVARNDKGPKGNPVVSVWRLQIVNPGKRE